MLKIQGLDYQKKTLRDIYFFNITVEIRRKNYQELCVN